jgi:Methylase involved in ubiquinone/menaquinone biosynthesis
MQEPGKETRGDSIGRFSRRAERYDRFRPGYPHDLVAFINTQVSRHAAYAVADVAAGTGIFTELIVNWGNPVYVVEPNSAMRRLAQRRLAGFSNCVFVDGTAEKTELPDASVDLVVSAQAFHWFDLSKAKSEFLRIARDGAYLAVVWNLRNTDSAFESGYEALIRKYAVDYLNVSQHRLQTEQVLAFFAPVKPEYRIFHHVDLLTLDQLRGRTLSYSYMPDEDAEQLGEMLSELETLYAKHQLDGRVRLSYKTRLFVGQLKDTGL